MYLQLRLSSTANYLLIQYVIEKTTAADLNTIHAEFETYMTQLTSTSTGEHNSRSAGKRSNTATAISIILL